MQVEVGKCRQIQVEVGRSRQKQVDQVDEKIEGDEEIEMIDVGKEKYDSKQESSTILYLLTFLSSSSSSSPFPSTDGFFGGEWGYPCIDVA